MDTFSSMQVDIAELVPGMKEALYGAAPEASEEVVEEAEPVDEEVVEEVNEDVDENSSEDSTQESESVDNEVVPEKPDALGEALARLSAQETLNKSLQSELDEVKVKVEAPRFIRYEELPEEIQREFDAEADRVGVDPRVIVYNHFQRILADHDAKSRTVAVRRESAAQTAMGQVDKFFDEHPLKANYGTQILESLKKNESWQALAPLAQRDPNAFQVAAVALLDAGFRRAEADEAIKQRTLKQQKMLKASTRGEASRATSSTAPTPKPVQGDFSAKAIVDAMNTQTNVLGRLFK